MDGQPGSFSPAELVADASATHSRLKRSEDGFGRPPFPAHPLGPLTAAEISQSSLLVRQEWESGTLFTFKVITLLEPKKEELVPYLQAEREGRAGTHIDRRSFVAYYIKNTASHSFHTVPGILVFLC